MSKHEIQAESQPTMRLVREAGHVGAALAALIGWDEQLHDWTAPDTYRDLRQLASAVVEATRPAELVAGGMCLACGDPEHTSMCGAPTGNFIYDTRCRCQWTAAKEAEGEPNGD